MVNHKMTVGSTVVPLESCKVPFVRTWPWTFFIFGMLFNGFKIGKQKGASNRVQTQDLLQRGASSIR